MGAASTAPDFSAKGKVSQRSSGKTSDLPTETSQTLRKEHREADVDLDQQQYESPELSDMRQEQENDQVKLASSTADGFPAYSFGYQTDSSSRHEVGDSRGVVRGQYTVKGADGSGRVVDYIADEGGFRAVVNSDEPGVASSNSASLVVRNPMYEILLANNAFSHEHNAKTKRLEGQNRGQGSTVVDGQQVDVASPRLDRQLTLKSIKINEQPRYESATSHRTSTLRLPN